MIRRPRTARRPASVLPLVALCIMAMVGFVALAVDVGVIAATRTQCQNAADAAAMAGARTINGDASTTYNVASVPGQGTTVRVALPGRIVDARHASDLIAKLSGKAYWRKLFVRKDAVPLDEARRICAEIIATGGMPRLF